MFVSVEKDLYLKKNGVSKTNIPFITVIVINIAQTGTPLLSPIWA